VLFRSLKPAEAVVHRDGRVRKARNRICGDLQELERAVRDWHGEYPFLVQPYMAGTGEGLFGLASDDGVHLLSAHRRLRMMNPHGSGASACQSQAVPDGWRDAASSFVRLANWQGLFMIEMLRDAQGRAWFIEFNGRPWGSLALARRQGLEYPAWQALLTCDPSWRPPSDAVVQPGLVCRYLGRELMHALFVLRGPQSKALVGWPHFPKVLLELLNVNGRQAFYNWRSDDSLVFFADCLNTLRDNLWKRRK
jgi:predicted ATP-grasp superfamily ATP-dependent carboligase